MAPRLLVPFRLNARLYVREQNDREADVARIVDGLHAGLVECAESSSPGRPPGSEQSTEQSVINVAEAARTRREVFGDVAERPEGFLGVEPPAPP